MSEPSDIMIRETVVQMLSQLLADTYILYLKTQNFHWNVVDPRFQFLHQMFEEQYKELSEFVDELAERIRMLNMRPPCTMKQFLDLTTLAEGEEEISGDEMIRVLHHDREAIVAHIRPMIQEASNTGDEGSADLLIQQLRGHEKTVWMLNSHLNG